MSACQTLTYTGVTLATWAAIKAAVEAKVPGLVIAAQDVGEDTAQGFTIAWAYDPPSGILTVTCTDSPWDDPCVFINAQIDGVIRPLLVTSP